MSRGSLPRRAVSNAVFSPEGGPALLFEEYPVLNGQKIRFEFEETNSQWRQGVFLATHGLIKIRGSVSPSFVVWTDTAPHVFDVEIVESTGSLVFYNVWDSGRGLGHFESQKHTSGMVRKDLPSGDHRYRCNDIGQDPIFDKLIFHVSMLT